MRLILLPLLMLGLSGCSIVYKLPTRQGNVIDQKQFDLLKLGQTRDQVKFLLGTPIATSPFRTDRWDYFGYYKDPRGKVSSRTISLYFDADKLARMEGVQIAGTARPLDSPDVERIQAEQQKNEAVEVKTAPTAEPAPP